MKKFIFNADDLAKTKFNNSAVIEAQKHGFLNSASLMVNNDNYLDAINNLKDFRLGIHLNLIEGTALNPNLTTICDEKGCYKNSYVDCLIKSFSKKFLDEVEIEFRSQIERMAQYSKISHIDSHVHTHSIPNIFKIVKKLALEYKIPYVRTQAEIPYYVKGTLSKDYLINLIKMVLLNYFTLINKRELRGTGLNTNDFIIGICYTGMMNSETVFEGIKKIKKNNVVVEALIHPENYYDNRVNSHTKEFKITLDKDLAQKITEMGYTI